MRQGRTKMINGSISKRSMLRKLGHVVHNQPPRDVWDGFTLTPVPHRLRLPGLRVAPGVWIPDREECTHKGCSCTLGKSLEAESGRWLDVGTARGHGCCRHEKYGELWRILWQGPVLVFVLFWKIVCNRNNEEINLAGDKIPYEDTQAPGCLISL